MRDLFLFSFFVNLFYFLIKNRKVDFFLLSFISSVVYFLPAFFGYYTLPTTYAPLYDIQPEAYLIYAIIFFTILFYTLIFDFVFSKIVIKYTSKEVIIPNLEKVFVVIGIIGSVAFFYLFGRDVFAGISKTELLEKQNGTYWELIWGLSSIFVIILSYINKKKIHFTFGILLLLLHLFVGHRSAAAFSAITVIIYYMYSMGKQKLLIYFFRLKYIAINFGILATIYFFFLYKQFANQIRNFRMDFIIKSATNINVYTTAITQAEPFIIQTNLNEVIRQKVKTDPIALRSIVKSFGFLFNKVDFQDQKLVYFNQNLVYPKLTYGAGNNIWAFVFASEGWAGLIIFVFIFFGIVLIGNLLLYNSGKILKSFLIVSFVYFCFYSHRNDLLTQIEIQKRVALLFSTALITALLYNTFTKNEAKQMN